MSGSFDVTTARLIARVCWDIVNGERGLIMEADPAATINRGSNVIPLRKDGSHKGIDLTEPQNFVGSTFRARGLIDAGKATFDEHGRFHLDPKVIEALLAGDHQWRWLEEVWGRHADIVAPDRERVSAAYWAGPAS